MRIMHVNLGGFGGTVDGITAAESQLAQLLEDAGHEVISINASGGLPALLSLAVKSAWRARMDRIQVVHIHSLFRPAHCVLTYLLRSFRIPYVVSPHSALSPAALARDRLRKRIFLDLLDRRMLRAAATVVCLTSREERDAQAVSRDLHTSVVPNPYVPQAGERWSWLPRDRPTLITLARYDTYHKGLDYLSLLASALPEVDILVYGVPDHNEAALIAAVVRSAPPNFSLKPPVVGVEKQRVLATANLYVQASRWEGLSISLIEALGVGVPVAVSPQVADTVPIEERGMGLVMSPDPWLAAATIRDLTADYNRQLEMSTAGMQWVEDTLTPDRVMARLEAVYALAARSDDQTRTCAPTHGRQDGQ